MDRLDGFMAQAKRQKLCDSSGGNWKIDAGFVNPINILGRFFGHQDLCPNVVVQN